MDYIIRPLMDDYAIVGRILTILSVSTYEMPKKPCEKEMGALDKLKLGEVIVTKDLEEKVLLVAEDKFYRENTIREELASGKSIVRVFEKYQIL